MKKLWWLLLLAGCLLLSACAVKPAEEPEQNETVHYSYADGTAVLSGNERVTGAADAGLTAGMEQLVLDLQEYYYRSLSAMEVEDINALFADAEEADYHQAVWRSLIAIRKASLVDLSLVDYSFHLTITDVEWEGEERVELKLLEDAVMNFSVTPDVDSEQFDNYHEYTLVRQSDGEWRIAEHYSDDNPYYNFTYDSEAGQELYLEQFLANVAARQATRGDAGAEVTLTWDHDYDRDAAYAYMMTYAEKRNSDWYVYDDLGGNCQNFGSQVLYAGGIPMDEEGDARWFWRSNEDQDYSWINVDLFIAYAADNEGYGLVAETEPNYYDAQVGDILILGDNRYRHTTEICGLITDEEGATLDYLLCSNTSNYRNFPASAYYYTLHWPVRIFGWNE